MRFMVESYLRAADEAQLDDVAARSRTAADELAAEGLSLRYVEAFLVPEDEMCLLIYDAESAEVAREASRRAGIACERVVELAQKGRNQ